MKQIANNFKELRTKAGLSQQEVSDGLKISRASVSALECGKRELKFIEAVNFGKLLEAQSNLKEIEKHLGEMDNRELRYYLKLKNK